MYLRFFNQKKKEKEKISAYMPFYLKRNYGV